MTKNILRLRTFDADDLETEAIELVGDFAPSEVDFPKNRKI